jgi:hypothetical protein
VLVKKAIHHHSKDTTFMYVVESSAFCPAASRRPKDTDSYIAHCPRASCLRKFTYEQLVSALMCHGCEQVDPINPVEDPMNGDIPLDRMKAEIMAYQHLEHNTLINPELALDQEEAKNNHHMSRHVQSCFKCWGKKNHSCGSKCKCRYHVPDCKHDCSVLKEEHDELKSWFHWDRTDVPRKNSEYLIKRLWYDVFQNVSCTPLDKWLGGSNNNARPMHGRWPYCSVYVQVQLQG